MVDPLFATYILCWCLVNGCRRIHIHLPWINDWLTDSVFIPVIAHLSLAFVRKIVVGNETYRFPLSYLLFMAAYASIVFECVLPKFSVSSTADGGDVVAYFAGSFFYYFIHQGKAAKNLVAKNL